MMLEEDVEKRPGFDILYKKCLEKDGKSTENIQNKL